MNYCFDYCFIRADSGGGQRHWVADIFGVNIFPLFNAVAVWYNDFHYRGLAALGRSPRQKMSIGRIRRISWSPPATTHKL